MKPGTLWHVAREGSAASRLKAARDGQAAVRLLSTQALLDAGLLDAVAGAGPVGRSTAELAAAIGFSRPDLVAALLGVGEANRLLRQVHGRWSLTRRGRALVRDDTARAVVEGLSGYHLDLYRDLSEQLHGGPGRADLELHGELIAKVSSVMAPFVRDIVLAAAAEVSPRRVLDIGCGEGEYLTAMLRTPSVSVGVGLEQDPHVAALAERTLAASGAQGRSSVVVGTAPEALDRVAAELGGPADLVLMANAIYYIPPAERVAFLRAVARVTSPGGVILLVTAVADPSAGSRHFGVLFLAQAVPMVLPTAEGLAADVRAAGLDVEKVQRVTPGEAVYAVTCRVPGRGSA